MSRWSKEYNRLPADKKANVIEVTNEIFRQETGFHGKIDPQGQPELAARWLAIRDDVMANQAKFARWMDKAITAAKSLPVAAPIYKALDNTPRWIDVARNEVGVVEAKGSAKNPRIDEYIQTTPSILQTENQRKYVARVGEDGVEWCSCFVNWCLKQAGIEGTGDALAVSWKNWKGGEKLSGPKKGAIVCFSWSGGSYINHVAFCDEKDGKLLRLGGNQGGHKNGGQVSSVPFEKWAAKHYIWPKGA